MVDDVSDDLCHEAGLEADALLRGWLLDHALELVARHGRERFGSSPHELTERVALQRAIVEVGPQGDHDPQAAVLIIDRGRQGLEKRTAGGRVRKGEQLLELVDDEEELRAIVG